MPANQGKTHYLEAAILNHILRGAAGGTAYTQPGHVYVGLLTANPGEAGSQASEVSTGGGTAYARQEVTYAAPTNNTTGSQVVSSLDVTFPVAGAGWGTVVYFGIFDAVSAGNMLYFEALTTPLTINAGDPVKFSAGQLVTKED